MGKAKAHINYIEYRSGDDKEKGRRDFFSDEREHVQGREIKGRLDDLEQRGVQMHKFILSPGIENVDVRGYTREMMDELSRSKGLELEWYAVEHRNTEHAHAHVVVMGTDLNGRQVRFDRLDSKHMREWGDRYLEREHKLERFLDREIERLLKDPSHKTREERQLEREFERWEHGDERDRRNAKDALRDHEEWRKLDKELHKAFSPERGLEHRLTYKQYQRQSAGRLLDAHERYTGQEFKERWKEIEEKHPEMAADARRELEWLAELQAEQKRDRRLEPDIERLLDGKDEHERFVDKIIEQELEPEDKELLKFLQEGIGPKKEHELEPKEQMEPEVEKTEDDAWQSFEIDRNQRSQGDRRDEKEREREDDFGR